MNDLTTVSPEDVAEVCTAEYTAEHLDKDMKRENDETIAKLENQFAVDIIRYSSPAVLDLPAEVMLEAEIKLGGIETDWSINPRNLDSALLKRYVESMEGYIETAKKHEEADDDSDQAQMTFAEITERNWIADYRMTLDGYLVNNHHSVTAMKCINGFNSDILVKVRVLPVLGEANAKILAAGSNRHGEKLSPKDMGNAVKTLFPFYELSPAWGKFKNRAYSGFNKIGAIIGDTRDSKTIERNYYEWWLSQLGSITKAEQQLELFFKVADKNLSPTGISYIDTVDGEALKEHFQVPLTNLLNGMNLEEAERFNATLNEINNHVRGFKGGRNKIKGAAGKEITQRMLSEKGEAFKINRAYLLSHNIVQLSERLINAIGTQVDERIATLNAGKSGKPEKTETPKPSVEKPDAEAAKKQAEAIVENAKSALDKLNSEKPNIWEEDKLSEWQTQVADAEKTLSQAKAVLATATEAYRDALAEQADALAENQSSSGEPESPEETDAEKHTRLINEYPNVCSPNSDTSSPDKIKFLRELKKACKKVKAEMPQSAADLLDTLEEKAEKERDAKKTIDSRISEFTNAIDSENKEKVAKLCQNFADNMQKQLADKDNPLLPNYDCREFVGILLHTVKKVQSSIYK